MQTAVIHGDILILIGLEMLLKPGHHNPVIILRLTGGNETVRYFTSIGYLTRMLIIKILQPGISNTISELTLLPKSMIISVLALGLLVRREERNYPTESAGSIFRMLMRGTPY